MVWDADSEPADIDVLFVWVFKALPAVCEYAFKGSIVTAQAFVVWNWAGSAVITSVKVDGLFTPQNVCPVANYIHADPVF